MSANNVPMGGHSRGRNLNRSNARTMTSSQTFYLRVSEVAALPVQIHCIHSNSHFMSNSWLKDNHIQEIISLLHSAVLSRVSSISGHTDNNNNNKQAQNNSDIISGSTVRFGYIFKSSPYTQTCLIDLSSLAARGDDGTHLKSLRILKDRLVVYAQPVVLGSTQGMSQLMKVLKEKRQSVGKVVSISSYFKKIPLKTVSDSYQTEETQTDSGLDSACAGNSSTISSDPFSDRKKKKIASILKKVDLKQARRQRGMFKAKVDNKCNENKCEYRSKHEESADTNLVCDDKHAREIGDVFENISGKTKPAFSNSLDTDVKVTDVKVSKFSVIEDKKINLKDYPCLMLSNNPNTSIVNVENMQDIKEENSSQLLVDGFVADTVTNMGNNRIGVQSISQDKVGDQSLSLHVLGNEQRLEDMLDEQALSVEMLSDHSDEADFLPDISILVKSVQQNPNVLDINESNNYVKFDTFEETGTDPESPKFGCKKKESKFSVCKAEDSSAANVLPVKDGTDADFKEESIKNICKKKRKFPQFLDTDTEDCCPDKKTKNAKVQENKYVNLERFRYTRNKLTLSKSFFTGDGNNIQPTLSFFINKQNKEDSSAGTSAILSTPKANETCDNNADVVECEHAEELSCTQSVMDELDLLLKEEVKAVKSINDLNTEQMHYLVRQNESYIRQIFEGHVECKRHQMYKTGGRTRSALNYMSCTREYTDEQIDVVMSFLMSIYCKRHHKYLDYLLKVLLQEILIRIHMHIHGTQYEESEAMLGSVTCESDTDSKDEISQNLIDN